MQDVATPAVDSVRSESGREPVLQRGKVVENDGYVWPLLARGMGQRLSPQNPLPVHERGRFPLLSLLEKARGVSGAACRGGEREAQQCTLEGRRSVVAHGLREVPQRVAATECRWCSRLRLQKRTRERERLSDDLLTAY